MKKLGIVALAAVVVAALLLWVASWFRADEAVVASAAQAWPGGMGTLEWVLDNFRPAHANAASAKVIALAPPKNHAVDEFVAREIGRAEAAIGEPPAIPDVSAVRDLLLREPIAWERQQGIGGDSGTQSRRELQMTLARALVAAALAKARAGDPASWDDLHAVWRLARSLDGHPQMMVQTAALSMARMVNAAAWKMPLPAPAWFGELQARDAVRPLLEAYQHQVASYWRSGMEMFPTKLLANSVEHDRRIAEEVFKSTRCEVTMPANELGVDVTSVWRRAFRYRAEREATANALRVREGMPVETKSACSDGSWSFDGTTLRFSRDIPTAPPDRPMPLVLRVGR